MYDLTDIGESIIENPIFTGVAHKDLDDHCDLCQRAWIEIDLAALAGNIQQVRRLLSPHTSLMAVVKADSYGHGAVMVAQTVLKAGASCLGVATVPEGIELREAGIKAPILILGAVISPEQVRALVDWKLEATVCSQQQARLISLTLETLGQKLSVHLKIDTGMSRLGVSWQDAAEFGCLLHSLPGLKIASVYSHLATADDADPTMMELQNQRFKDALVDLETVGIKKPKLHIANSAATLRDPQLHYDLVRVGLAMYGYYPASHLRSLVRLTPALTVKAKVTQVKTIPAGTGVSYGHQFVAHQPTTIAVVGIGYADGVPRQLSNQIQVLVKGQLVPQIGAIAMDQMMLDVTNIPDVKPGDVVTLLGKEGNILISAEDWAQKLGTITWEILCGFKHRLPRVPLLDAGESEIANLT
jgi:alanine racemase